MTQFQLRILRNRAANCGWLLVDNAGVLTLREFSTSITVTGVGYDHRPLTAEDVMKFIETTESMARGGRDTGEVAQSAGEPNEPGLVANRRQEVNH